MSGNRLKFYYRVGAPLVPTVHEPTVRGRVLLDQRGVRPFTDLVDAGTGGVENRVALGQAVSLIRLMGGMADLYIAPDALPDADDRAVVALMLAAVDSAVVVGLDGQRAVNRDGTDRTRDLSRVLRAELRPYLRGLWELDLVPAMLRGVLRLTGRESQMIINRARLHLADSGVVDTLGAGAIDYRARQARDSRFPLVSSNVVSPLDLDDDGTLGMPLVLTALLNLNVSTSWRPRSTTESKLLDAVFTVGHGHFTAGDPRRESTAESLATARRLIPFASRVLAWQYLNDPAPATDASLAAVAARSAKAEGSSLREVADLITTRGFATRRGDGRWSASAIKALLGGATDPEKMGE